MSVTINGVELADEAIEFEFQRLLRYYSSHIPADQLRQQADMLRERARDQAIGAKLLIDRAKQLELSVPGDRLDAKIDELAEDAGGREELEKRLAEQDMTIDSLQASIEEGCKVEMLIEQVCTEVPDPKEDEIKAHYEANAADYNKPERAEARHILIKPNSDSDEDKGTARSRVEELRAKVVEGGDFAELAESFSDCPSGKQGGGSLGWFGRGMMVPEFDEVVFEMAANDLSEVIETQFGYHLVQKTGKEEGSDASYSEAADQIRDLLRHSRRGEAVTAYVEELKEKADIQITD
jgi:parvulin-like peptidyl-prolyl isomerase